jgi:DNA-binding GntR family transcriptional regulator
MTEQAERSFTPVEQPLLVEVVADELRTAIFEGRLKPNDRLSDYQIARDMGLSRSPVREAIRRLAARGLVRETARRGAVVASLSRADAVAIYDCRRALEGLAARRVAETSGSSSADVLDAIRERMGSVSQAKDGVGTAAIDAEFHMKLCELAGNPWLDRLSGMIADQNRLIQTLNNLVHPPRGVDEMREIHLPIVEAIASGDPDRAASAVIAHIDEAERQFLAEADGILDG